MNRQWVAKLALVLGLLGMTGVLTGCNLNNPPPPPPARVSGTVEDIWYRYDLDITSDLWSAQLMVSPDYNGAPNVNIANNGNDNICFKDFIHNGDRLTIVAASSGSFNDLDASDVTVNGTKLSAYSGC